MKYFRLLIIFFFILLSNLIYCQKKTSLESRVQYLEKSLDSLKLQVKYHRMLYAHDNIEINKIRSRLALEMNRNFTYFAYFYEAEPDNKNGKGYQRIFVLNGYHSVTDFNNNIANDQSHFLKTIRQNLIGIKDIIVGQNTEIIKYSEDYTSYPNRAMINYYDNSSGGEPLIIADTELKTLKVRINGIMQEIGWE